MPIKLRLLLKSLKSRYQFRKKTSLEAKLIVSEFDTDRARFTKHSTPKDTLFSTADKSYEYQTQIDRDVHRVEKGLALRTPKRPFGKDLKIRLNFLQERIVSTDKNSASTIERALNDLEKWNNGEQACEESAPVFSPYVAPRDFNLRDFFWGRKSIRVFSNNSVDRAVITEAVDLARNSPSVCNRQSWRVYAIDTAELLAQALPLQNGNESFRSEIKMALIITSDLNKFSSAGERNQVWIDGGLFSMSLAWALHGLGLGTCMLNWSVNNSQSDKLRGTVGIPANEEIMMLMAVGHPETNIRYARSEKKPIEEILFWPKG